MNVDAMTQAECWAALTERLPGLQRHCHGCSNTRWTQHGPCGLCEGRGYQLCEPHLETLVVAMPPEWYLRAAYKLTHDYEVRLDRNDMVTCVIGNAVGLDAAALLLASCRAALKALLRR